MGNKSKSKRGPSKNRAQDAAPAQAFNKKASRVKRIETAEDAMGGDEDAFHSNRDSVLFEDNGKGSDNGMDVSDDDEIFGLNLPESESESELAADEDEELDEDEEEDEPSYPAPLPEAARGRFAKTANPAQDVISDGSDAASDAASDAGGASDSEEETWAANSYHATRRAPGEPDSEDDEALGMEADEARRLQKRAKGAMAGADFGLAQDGEDDDAGLEEVRETQRKRGRLEDDQASAAGEAVEMGDEEAIAFLLRKNPETLALLDDFTATAERMTGVERNLVEVRAAGKDGKDHPALAIMELEHQALSTYLPTLAFYFSLLLTPAPSTELVSKVLERLSTLRSALATMEELDLTSGQLEDSDSEDESDDGEEGESMLASDVWDLGSDEGSEDVEGMFDDEAFEGQSGSEDDSDESGLDADESSMLGGLDDDELEMIMDGMDENATADDLMLAVDAYRREKLGASGTEDDDESDNDAAPSSAGSKRKAAPAKTPRSKKAKLSVPSIPILAPLSRKTSRAAPVAVESDYADATSLSRTDESDKASKRHTLRFHVSQVSQKAAKRESGGKNRVGGDDDLPRRSKERSRREVLKRQEHGGSKGEALDGQDWDDEDRKIARRVTKGEDDGEDYYDLVKKDKDGGKLAKQEKYDAQRMAEKNALDQEGDASAAGPRGVTRKILANKGLQPKRAKINRNSRVKKRVQYDKAVKKVATMKSVYKGGQATLGHGEYQGEKSGIGSKVVKSVRLGGK